MQRSTTATKEAVESYRTRAEVLADIGYDNYYQYLKSDLWQRIRQDVLSRYPECAFCSKPATQVHHAVYDKPTMLGVELAGLFPICRDCHGKGEFGRSRRKLSPHQATSKMIRNSKKYRRKCAAMAKKPLGSTLSDEQWRLLPRKLKEKLRYQRWASNEGKVTQRTLEYTEKYGAKPPTDAVLKRELKRKQAWLPSPRQGAAGSTPAGRTS